MRPRGLLLLLLALPARAQDAPAPLLLRLQVEHQGPAWIGQRVTVTLTVMTPARFVNPLGWPEIVARTGRVIVLPEAATVPGTERVGGQTYVALSRSYAVFPATPGDVVLAPLAVQARVAGADGQPVTASAGTEATPLTVRVPPGVTDLGRLVVAPAFTMVAQVDGNAARIHVGDAVTRTVTMRADDTAAMMLPPVAWQAPDGIRVYAEPPDLQDRSERGTLHALRRERAAFVPQRPGPFALPGFTVDWLDPRGGRIRQVTVGPVRLEVLPAVAVDAPATGRRGWLLGAGVVAILLCAAGILWAVRRFRGAAPSPLRGMRAACRTGDARAALRALYRWSDAVMPPGGDRTIARLAALSATPELLAEARRVESVVFGKGAGWDGTALAAAARRATARLKPSGGRRAGSSLPPLNPAASRSPPRLAQPRWVR